MIEIRKIAQASIVRSPYILSDDGVIIAEVSQFLDLLCLRGVSLNTLRAYAFDLLAFYRFLDVLRITLEEVSHCHAIDFIRAGRERNLAPRTINRRIQTISAFLRVTNPKLAEDIFTGPVSRFYKGRKNTALLGPAWIKPAPRGSFKVKVPRRLILPLSEKVIQKFLANLNSFRDRSILLLMLALGLRSSEVIGLKIHDIDFEDRRLRVRGKGDKERIMPLADWVAGSLKRYLDFERPRVSHQSSFVVLKGLRRGLPLSLEGLRKIFRYRRTKALLKNANPHRFRHTFCTNLISQGVSLPIVQKLMGHDSIETTLIYINLSNEDVSKEYHRAMAQIGMGNA